MQYNDGYDGYYEAKNYADAAEAEAQEEEQYQKYLDKLISEGQHALFAAYVAIDWLNSTEFKSSKLSAIDFLMKKKEQIKNTQKSF